MRKRSLKASRVYGSVLLVEFGIIFIENISVL